MENIKILIEKLALEIQTLVKGQDYIKIYGTFTIEKNVQNVIGRNLFIEAPNGDIFQEDDWDMFLEEDVAKLVTIAVSKYTQEAQSVFPCLVEKTGYRLSFTIGKDVVMISQWVEEDYEIDHFQRVEDWKKTILPRNPLPSLPPWEKESKFFEKEKQVNSSYSLENLQVSDEASLAQKTTKSKDVEILILEITHKINIFVPFEVDENYVYVQWNNQKDEVQCEVGVFLKNDLEEAFHIDLLENHGVDRDKIIEFTFELEDTVHHFMKQDGKVDYVEFAYSSKNQNQSDILLLNFDLNSPLDYPIRQKQWLKEMFDSSVKLPIHYQIDTILSEPNEEYTPKISKNFLVRNGAPIQHSRFLGNHVKVLNNAEIKVYAKLLKRLCNQKLEPFLIVNTGNIFVYSKKENRIYIYFPSDDYCMDLMTATPDNINYLIEGYFSELSRIKLVFNSDLLEQPLKEDEILYAPSFSNQDTTSFIATEMKNAIELLASGM